MLKEDNNSKFRENRYCKGFFLKAKKAQLALFIILAIVLVVAIALIFFLRFDQVTDLIRPDTPSPQAEMELVMETKTREAIDLMLPQGGYINVTGSDTPPYVLYDNGKISYLCYNMNYYYPCINQQPMFIRHLEQEIHDYILPSVEESFDGLIQSYKDGNFDVDTGPLNLNVELRPKQVRIDIEKRITATRGDETREYENFRKVISSPLYDLSVVAKEIASQEAQYCNFEYLGFSLLYPWVSIEKDQIGGGETASKIYKIRDKNTDKTLNIAIRSCAMPAGL